MGPIIEIEKSGVIHIQNGYETYLRVDSDDLLVELEEAIENTPHNADYEGRFAGRMKIEIEFMEALRAKEENEEREEA